MVVVKAEPLEYASPKVQRRKRAVLPFVLLAAGVLEIIGGALLIIVLAAGAGDDNGMTAAQRADMRLIEGLIQFDIYFGAIVGLLGGIYIAIRRRRYGVTTLVCAIFGIALCLLPALLYIRGRTDLLDPQFWR